MILLALNKPYGVVCQFSEHGEDQTLAHYITQEGVYAAGRLDKDSEGLLLLTDDGDLQHQISQPVHKMPKGYWVQVEGTPGEADLAKLRHGVQLKDGLTKPAEASLIETPPVWERHPPIRERKSIPTSWLDITITEGRNRQVRRMCAAIGYPTLRLIRYRIGPWYLNNLAPGNHEQRKVSGSIKQKILQQQFGKKAKQGNPVKKTKT